MHARTPFRLTAITRSHISGSVSVKKPNSSMPALLTSTSSVPAVSTAARADSGSVTSSATASAPRLGRDLRRRRCRCPRSTPRAPSAARRRTIASPIPFAPPVTSALRPSSRIAAAYGRRGDNSGMTEVIPIIGGTGALGYGLALRWAREGADRGDRVPKRRARDRGRWAGDGRGARRQRRGPAERRGGPPGDDRVPVRPVPRPVERPTTTSATCSRTASSSSIAPRRWRPP